MPQLSVISQRAVALKPSLTLAISAKAKYLLKEGKDLNMVELERDLYKHLSENDLIKLDDINESVGFDFLQEGKYIVTDQLEDLNGNITAEVGDIVYTTENQKPFDNYFGVNLYHVINEDTKQKVMVSEDNIERIRL